MQLTLFEAFRVPVQKIDPAVLQESYHRLMKEAHPDASSGIDRKTREELSGFLSKSYKKLRDDYSRSIYLYSLNNKMNLVNKEFSGVNKLFGLSGERVSIVDSAKDRVCEKNRIEPEFLDEVLYLEEKIEGADRKGVCEIRQDIEDRVEKCKEQAGDVSYLVKWRYYIRLLESIRKREEFLDAEESGGYPGKAEQE
jgi:hypothetical protein